MAINSKTPPSFTGSSSMFETFGNEVKQRIDKSTLTTYLNNATVKFPLPEASSEILAKLGTSDVIKNNVDPYLLEQVISKLVAAGFQEANARAMADVLMQTSKKQNISPLTYFAVNDDTVKLTTDTCEILNALMPPGNRINVAMPKKNSSNKNVFTAK